MRILRRVLISVLLAAVIAGATLVWLTRAGPVPQDASGEPAAAAGRLAIGGAFTLVDAAGRTVHADSFGGRWLLVYFGYTTCPDICPTTLQTMAGALAALGPLSTRIAPLFITIDPARDTTAVLGRYTALFDPRIVGLTGTAAQVAGAEQAYHVYAEKVAEPGANSYLMNHTSFIYLMAPDGRLAALFNRDVTTAALADALRGALGKNAAP